MDYSQIKEGLKGLINDKTTPEDAEKIGGIITQLESAEKEYTEVVKSQEELRKKYINVVTQSGTSEKPKAEIENPQTPKSLEECINDTIKARK